ncbi:MAG: hypothetical protein ACOCRX_08875 [Candidatus Woesearchaeota archaeon]
MNNEITIPGNKKTKSKKFKVGKFYRILPEWDHVPALVELVNIKDNQLIFETIFNRRIYRATTKQFSTMTKSAKSCSTKYMKEEIFDNIFKYERFKVYYIL